MDIDSSIHRCTLCFIDPAREEAYRQDQREKRDKITLASIWLFTAAWLGFAVYLWIETQMNPALQSESRTRGLSMGAIGFCLLLEMGAIRVRVL